MHKKFEINRTKIKGGCQSGRNVVTHDSKNELPLYDNKANLKNSSQLRQEGLLLSVGAILN